MMETVLNIGLNDACVKGLAEVSGNERFAWDSYRRLLQMFGKTVLDMPGEVFAEALDKAKAAKGVTDDIELDVDDLQEPGRRRSSSHRRALRVEFPQHPREQLDLAMRAVFDSWNTDRARLYRRRERIPQDLGTAVNVCAMVFGNLGDTSGTGVASPATRHRASRASTATTCPTPRARTSSRASATRCGWRTSPRLDPSSHRELTRMMRRLETHYRDLCDIEFTVERGKLWMLQTRVGKRTAGRRVPHRHPTRRRAADHPGRGAAPGHRKPAVPADVPPVRPGRRASLLTKGMAASPGAAVGEVVFDSATATAGRAAAGRSSWCAARPSPTTWKG